jgi:hypothetical protein
MPSSESHTPDFALVESAGKGEYEEDFVVLSGRGGSDLEVRRISGAAALLEALRALAPRRVILDFHASFRRSLELSRALKRGAPELALVARVCPPGSNRAEPLYFSVEVRTSRVSLHRMRPEEISGMTTLHARYRARSPSKPA